MTSIRARLIVLFLVLATGTLALFGIYAQLQLARNLETRFAQLQVETVSRLAISVPRTIWDLDAAGAHSVLHGEMLAAEVLAIEIVDSSGRFFASTRRGAEGGLQDDVPGPGGDNPQSQADLYFKVAGAAPVAGSERGTLMGKVVVTFSRAGIDATLRADAWRRVIEILIVDAALLITLILSLRMVFRPLAQLRDALFDLARHEGTDVEELPETQSNEFGDVVRGFNQTQRKVQLVMQRRQQAEELAKAAALRSEVALEELKAAQASLVQAEKLAGLGGLVAGVAHEINTPVGIALTSASVLHAATLKMQTSMEDGAIRKSEVVAYMATAEEASRLIMRNAERAALLIQSFKQVAVDQTSEMRRDYELREYIDEVMSSLHSKLKLAKVTVQVDCPERIPLDGYPGAMAQVLTNLTMNSLAHAFAEGQEGRIDIAARAVNGNVQLTYRDNGRGIEPENIAKVFDPFFTTRRGQGGTGLGLNIVHNILSKKFGGTIVLTSVLGQGVCFEMHFPAVSP